MTAHRGDRRTTTGARAALPGVLIGVGLAGTLDEVVLHQLLRWHHFYDRSTSAVGLISDGLFHAASTAALAVGFVILIRRLGELPRGWGAPLVGWILVGAGGFNLYDGTIQHKVLGLHQVRSGARSLLVYDVAFIGVAAVVALAGVALLRGRPRAGG